MHGLGAAENVQGGLEGTTRTWPKLLLLLLLQPLLLLVMVGIGDGLQRRALTLPGVEAASSSPWCLFVPALLGQKTEDRRTQGLKGRTEGRGTGKENLRFHHTVAPQLVSYQPE